MAGRPREDPRECGKLRASAATMTQLAPPAFKAVAASMHVAPVVNTSSMTITDSGAGRRQRIDPWGLTRRSTGSRNTCGGVSKLRTRSETTVDPICAAASSASRCAWSNPRSLSFFSDIGTNVMAACRSSGKSRAISAPRASASAHSPRYLRRCTASRTSPSNRKRCRAQSYGNAGSACESVASLGSTVGNARMHERQSPPRTSASHPRQWCGYAKSAMALINGGG